MISCEDMEHDILSLDASKCVETAMWAANQIASDDCVHFGGGPQGALLVRKIQIITKISSNQLF